MADRFRDKIAAITPGGSGPGQGVMEASKIKRQLSQFHNADDIKRIWLDVFVSEALVMTPSGFSLFRIGKLKAKLEGALLREALTSIDIVERGLKRTPAVFVDIRLWSAEGPSLFFTVGNYLMTGGGLSSEFIHSVADGYARDIDMKLQYG